MSISEKKQKRIERIIKQNPPYITTYLSAGGWQSVMLTWEIFDDRDPDGGCYTPFQTGFNNTSLGDGSYEGACKEAEGWAEAEGMEYRKSRQTPETEETKAKGERLSAIFLEPLIPTNKGVFGIWILENGTIIRVRKEESGTYGCIYASRACDAPDNDLMKRAVAHLPVQEHYCSFDHVISAYQLGTYIKPQLCQYAEAITVYKGCEAGFHTLGKALLLMGDDKYDYVIWIGRPYEYVLTDADKEIKVYAGLDKVMRQDIACEHRK